MRSWEYLLIELGVPLIFLVIFNQVSTKSDITNFQVSYEYQESFCSSFVTPYDKVYFFPNSSATLSFMQGAEEYTIHRAAPMESLPDTVERLMVVLDMGTDQEVPMNLKFQVVTQLVYTDNKTFDIFLDRLGPDVLQVQYIVTKMFITYWWKRLNRTAADDAPRAEFEVLPLPDPPYSWRLVWRHYVMGWVITTVFLGTACMTALVIVQEKECGVKEIMESMGMASFTYWLTCSLPSLVNGLLTTYMFASNFFWGNENSGGWSMAHGPEVLLPLLALYVLNTVSFAFLVSCFINKASHASGIVCTAFVISRILPPIASSYVKSTFAAHVIGCVLYHTGIQLYYIMVAFQVEEYFFDNRHWWPFYPILDQLTMLDVLIMLVSNTIFNLAVAWFVESGRGRRSWLFLKSQAGLLVGYFPSDVFRLWFKEFMEIKQPSKTFLPEALLVPELNRQVLEPPMADMVATIEIRNIVKIFDSHVTVAINSINVYKDHVTVLLGQNGAGKTTMVNMITGSLSPTSGTVFVNGHDVTTDLNAARGLMGVCRQRDVLFDQLTCREHLVFYDQVGEAGYDRRSSPPASGRDPRVNRVEIYTT
ncbi:hypothetical protein Btru_020951 [Bulinus truncatus]|nr:hypothetical protein Btru_020951 [Bulinus truncatus]